MAKPKTKKNIDLLIMTGEWEINVDWGLQMLAQYLHQVEMGQDASELIREQLKENRERQRPVILEAASFEQVTFGSSALSDVGNTPRGSIAHIKITGVMQNQSRISTRGMDRVAQDLRAADNNPNIDGIFLEVESGGGQGQAGTTLQNALIEISTPIVTYYHLLASAALKGVLPSDMIIGASNGTKVGSIGTVATINKKILAYFQENMMEIYADTSGSKNKEFRALLQGDTGPVQEMVNRTNDYFIEEVQRFRTLIDGDLTDQALDGQLMNTDQAIEIGLVDGAATFSGALNQLTGIITERQSLPATFQVPAFNNQNQSEMNLQKFLQSLIPALKQTLGLEIKEDAEASQVLEAIQGMPTLENLKQTIKDELQQEMQSAHDQLQSQVEKLTTDLQALQTRFDEQQAELTTANEAKTALEQELASLKGQGDDIKDKQKDKPIVPHKVQPGASIFQAVAPEGKAKY